MKANNFLNLILLFLSLLSIEKGMRKKKSRTNFEQIFSSQQKIRKLFFSLKVSIRIWWTMMMRREKKKVLLSICLYVTKMETKKNVRKKFIRIHRFRWDEIRRKVKSRNLLIVITHEDHCSSTTINQSV